MHEYTVCEQIVQIAAQAAREHHALRVTRVTLVIGELTGFIEDAIRLCFDMVAEGTPAQGAQLEIVHVKAELQCNKCNHRFAYTSLSFACPLCGGLSSLTEDGRQFLVKHIEMESDEK